MYEKDFGAWNTLKIKMNRQHHEPTFREREIWWCSVGVNIGFEVDGKNEFFNRPVLVLRKFNKRMFWGIPLSTKIKDNSHYFLFTFNGTEQSALITHMRLYDSKRLTHKMGKLPPKQMTLIQQEVVKKILK